jgi:hypothetical protein
MAMGKMMRVEQQAGRAGCRKVVVVEKRSRRQRHYRLGAVDASKG